MISLRLALEKMSVIAYASHRLSAQLPAKISMTAQLGLQAYQRRLTASTRLRQSNFAPVTPIAIRSSLLRHNLAFPSS
jgi:hypothetical protein